MKKFIAVYYAPAEAMAAMANITPEQAAEGMKPWFAWKEKCGDAVVDFGSPLMPGNRIEPSGSWSASTAQVTGFSILQGGSLDEVKAFFDGHPHLSWAPGCAIDVHEFAPM